MNVIFIIISIYWIVGLIINAMVIKGDEIIGDDKIKNIEERIGGLLTNLCVIVLWPSVVYYAIKYKDE